MAEYATCGVCIIAEGADHPECCICLKKLCRGGSFHKNLCKECLPKLTERNAKGELINPSTGTPITMCICGKIWNVDCSQRGIFGERHMPTKLAKAAKF